MSNGKLGPRNFAAEFDTLDKKYGLTDPVLSRLKRSVGDQKLLVCTIGYTGGREFGERIGPRLDRYGIKYEARQLPERDDREGKYRPFDADPKELRTNAETLVLFDGIIEEGGTMTGAIVWGLKNSSALGIKRVISLAMKDNRGYANYSFVPDFFRDRRYVGPLGAIREIVPDMLPSLRDYIPLLSDENPYDHGVFRMLSEKWRENVDSGEIASTHNSTRLAPSTEAQILSPSTALSERECLHLLKEVAIESMIPLDERPIVQFRVKILLKRILQQFSLI